jgi:hypothetical protein
VCLAGWVFDGILADGNNATLGIRGQDWECPIFAKLPTASKAAVTAAIAASTAATAAIAASTAATAAKLPLAADKPAAVHADVTTTTTSSSSSKSDVYVRPSTPQLKGMARAATTMSSLSSLSGFGGSSASLATAAAAAAEAAEQSPAIAASPATGRSAAAASRMLALPLTEPALAAAMSAAATPLSTDYVTLTHPAVNVDAWVEHQTQQQVQKITPAAIADSAAGGVISSQDDIAVLILGDDDAESDSKGVQYQPMGQVTSLTVSSSNAALEELTGSIGGGCGSNGGSSDKCWWFCMSPDACNNPTWWLGDYDGDR